MTKPTSRPALPADTRDQLARAIHESLDLIESCMRVLLPSENATAIDLLIRTRQEIISLGLTDQPPRGKGETERPRDAH